VQSACFAELTKTLEKPGQNRISGWIDRAGNGKSNFTITIELNITWIMGRRGREELIEPIDQRTQ
jgi:hypothetical protein